MYTKVVTYRRRGNAACKRGSHYTAYSDYHHADGKDATAVCQVREVCR